MDPSCSHGPTAGCNVRRCRRPPPGLRSSTSVLYRRAMGSGAGGGTTFREVLSSPRGHSVMDIAPGRPPTRLLTLWLLLATTSPLCARTLADQLHQFLDMNAFPQAGFPDAITPI